MAALPDTIYVDDVDLSSLTSCTTSLDGLYTTPGTRGNNVVIPGINGEDYVDKPFDAGTVTIQLALTAATTGEFNDAYDALRRACKPGKQVRLVRRRSQGSGTSYLDLGAYGEYVSGLEPQVQLARFTNVSITFRVLSGLWYGINDISVSGTSLTIYGDTRTHRIWLNMNPGTATNSTTGSQVTYTGPNPVTVDVENMSASDGTDKSNYLFWDGDWPFALEPGVNNVTGINSLVYRPAYF